VWDEPDRPEIHMYLGKPTGSAMPLSFSRLRHNGQVFRSRA